MSLEGKAYSTVRTYVAGIGSRHKMNDWEDPSDNYLLKKVMQGLSKTRSQKDSRLPITIQKLKQLVPALPSVCSNTYEVALFKAAFTLAFLVFFG
jgi:hypothetical protein